jgi:hypothetical protein
MTNIIEPPANVVQLMPQRTVCDDLVQSIRDAVYSYAGRLSVAETLGCIEIAVDGLRKELL